EGTSVRDFFDPPKTVIGEFDVASGDVVAALYEGLPGEVLRVPIPVAEMTKYADNAFHGLKIGFANELGSVCRALGLDSYQVMDVFLADRKLNVSPAYLRPGFAFGGSCLPKDLRALTYLGKELDCELPLLDSIMASNREHIERAAQFILARRKKKIGMLGLSFKSGTDDLRESPQVMLIKKLLGEGLQVQIWDENVYLGRVIGSNRQFIDDNIPHIGSLLDSDLERVVCDNEIVVIGTKVNRAKLELLLMSHQIVIDLIGLYKQDRVRHQGEYQGICW
ncbi:MAG: nucleotide sugar dehydrogenase, partial [bacterium]